MIGWMVLVFITLQRIFELLWSRANTKRLLSQGAKECFSAHYPFIVALHTSWILILYLQLIFTPQIELNIFFLSAFVFLTLMRFWVLATLGRYFTTRIISSQHMPLVKKGPYRFMKHPNYAVVMGEIICVPMIFGWWSIAAIWGGLNALILWLRIHCESQALSGRP